MQERFVSNGDFLSVRFILASDALAERSPSLREPSAATASFSPNEINSASVASVS